MTIVIKAKNFKGGKKMENASKALIIAGAILISILIIGLGVFIYNNARSTVGKADLSSTEAQAQNQQFEAYFGNNISAQQVKQLLSLIRTNNITGAKNGDTRTIAVIFKNGAKAEDATTGVTTIATSVKTGYTYTIKAANDNASSADSTSEFKTDNGGYYTSGYLRIIEIDRN